MEAHFYTQKSAPLIVGGIPDVEKKEVKYALELPGLLSFLAHGDLDAEVTGLDRIPEEDQPPVVVAHYAFQIMVGCGVLMLLVSVTFFIALLKKGWFYSAWLPKLFTIAMPLGFIAVEAGWTVTEVGRQPWIIQGVMKTADAVTPMPGIVWSFVVFTLVYVTLSIAVIFLLYRQIKMVPVLYDKETAQGTT
jgi:cytochrome d ubiquinol oxidase subunit I